MKFAAVAQPVDGTSLPRTSSLCAIFVVLTGFSVLLGWYLKSALLVQIFPSFAPMQFNTSLGFILVGVGLYALSNNLPKVGMYCGSLAAILGLLTLYQYLSGVGIGIDQLFMQHTGEVNTSYPGRMAPKTALCFALAGIGLAVCCAIPKRDAGALVFALCGAMVTALSSIAIIGYLFGLSNEAGWGALARMALHTAVVLFVLSIGILSQASENAKNIRNFRTVVAPLTAFVGSLTVTILMWQSILEGESKFLLQHLTAKAEQIAAVVSSDFDANIDALDRMRQRWEFNSAPSAAGWANDANNYIEDSRLFDGLYVLDHNHRTILSSLRIKEIVVRGSPSESGYLEPNTFELFEPPDLRLEKSFLWHLSANVFQILMPTRESSLASAIVAEVNAERWFNEVVNSKPASRSLASSDLDVRIISSPSAVPKAKEGAISATLPLQIAGRDWQVFVTRNEDWRKNQSIGLPTVVLVAGSLVSSLLAVAIFFWGKVRDDAVELETANLVLSEAYSEKEKAEQHLKLLLDNAAEGIFGLDAAGLTTFVNPAACEMLGIEPEELLGKSMSVTIANNQVFGQSDDSSVNHICASVLDGKVHAHNDEVLWRKNGNSFAVDYTSTPVFKHDDLVGAVIVFRDISGEIAQAKKLTDANTNLILVNNELEEFAYVASHDLRTPLQGIGNLAEWIEEDLGQNLPPAVSKNLSRIKTRIDRLQNLIDDLLSYSRATRTEHEIAEVHLGELINELISDLNDGREFKYLLHDCDRKIRILRTPFQTVLRNLLDNAMKHHDETRGEIEIFVHSENDGFVSVAVVDDGPGIPLEQHQRIFKLFETLNGHKGTSGTGIGLAITKRLVSKYGGEINVTTGEDGRGCCFTFTWPTQN